MPQHATDESRSFLNHGSDVESSPYQQQSATKGAQTYAYGPAKRGVSKWVKYGLPLLILILAGAGVGGYFGWKASKNNSDAATTGAGPGTSASDTAPWTGDTTSVPSNVNASVAAAASAAAKLGGGNDLLYAGTDVYGNPAFKPLASSAGSPTGGGTEPGMTCTDSWTPSDWAYNGDRSPSKLRPHPRLIAPQHEWDCLPARIANDAYLTAWNATIFMNATNWAAEPPVNYTVDGGLTGSGILDPARDVQQRVKAWAYAYKVSKDTSWMDRLYTELNVAAGHVAAHPWTIGDSHWNPQHFLDVGELTSAFALAYDWLYNDWSSDQKAMILNAIVTYGLTPGQMQFNATGGQSWFLQTAGGNGNWNCVTNGGLITGALAVSGDDTSGIADYILENSVSNFHDNCMTGVYPDGTWSETPHYWYFGTNAHARVTSALTTATGTNTMSANPDFTKTGFFHMYVSGNGGMFSYGDNGPNKYATTANQMFYYSRLENNPLYALFQRDRADAADPLSMFWYDTSSKGAFWNGLPLDRFFDHANGAWVSMRSSWTDFQGTYVAMKASLLQGHQTHGDLDIGDFVIDAMGTRWAGEYGSGNYLSNQYFTSEAQDAMRWQYYRKGTQGQNTLVINKADQRVDAAPVNKYDTTNATQTNAIDYKPGVNDVAYFTTDMSSAYNGSDGSVVRGIRMLNGRRQILVQDDIAASVSGSVEWRVQTNATITLSSDGRTATLTQQNLVGINAGFKVNGALPKPQTMVVKIVSPADAKFTVQIPPASRIYGTQPPLAVDPDTGKDEDGDQTNKGVSVLRIQLTGGSDQSIQVVWQPQWSDLTAADNATPTSVPISQWSLTSHNA